MIQETNRVKSQIPWPVVTDETVERNQGEGPRIKVRCIHPKGVYYEYLRRREGDVFYLVPKWITVCNKDTGSPVMENGKAQKRLVTAAEQFSSVTMEKVEDEDEPETITTSQMALNRVVEELSDSGSASPARKGRR